MTETVPQTTTFTPATRFAVPGRIAAGQGGSLWQRATIAEIRRETPDASTFRFAVPGWQGHLPGQHLMMRLTAEDGYTAQRHYSLASAPDDSGHIELTLDHVEGGEVSGFLHTEARVGDEVELRGPLSGFFAWPGDRPALLLGAGSGVVPLMSMIRHHRRLQLDLPLKLFVSARTRAELIYADEYGPETTPVLTREGERRRLDLDHLTPCFKDGAPDWEAYVCGSNSFAEHASQLLVSLGQPVDRIRIERFG